MHVTKIFAYGSLLNENSLKQTVPEAQNIYPAKIYGYKRIFDLVSAWRFDENTNNPICVLNVKKKDNNNYMNGICFDMTNRSFKKLLEREKNYDLHEVEAENYFDNKDKQKAFLFTAKNYK